MNTFTPTNMPTSATAAITSLANSAC